MGGPFQTPNGEDFYLSWHASDHTYTHVQVTALGAEALRGIHDKTLVFEVMLGFFVGGVGGTEEMNTQN